MNAPPDSDNDNSSDAATDKVVGEMVDIEVLRHDDDAGLTDSEIATNAGSFASAMFKVASDMASRLFDEPPVHYWPVTLVIGVRDHIAVACEGSHAEEAPRRQLAIMLREFADYLDAVEDSKVAGAFQ